MQHNLKLFIETYIHLIEQVKFVELYENARVEIPFQIGNLTSTLIQAGINPLDYLESVVPSMFRYSEMISIKIPANIKDISRDSFRDCYSLKEIQLPKTIEHIHNTAFKGCYELNKIIYEGTMEDWENRHIPWKVFNSVLAEVVTCSDGDVKIPWHD